MERFIGVNLKNQSEYIDKIPNIPEILKSQIIKMDTLILFFKIILVLKLIQKQFYRKVNTMGYHHRDEHYLHKNINLIYFD